MMHGSVEDIEIKLLIQAIHACYGYDFGGYNEASFKRLVTVILSKYGIPTISRLQDEILQKPDFFARVLPDLTVTTSEMFRDPAFYREFREEIIPFLSTWSAFKIWHAGCSTGEEVYSLAILLKEAGLYDRAVIYATDINPTALKVAREGIYPVTQIKRDTQNYIAAGGRESFSSYYMASYDAVRFDPTLRKNILFATHNLVVDDVFCEAHVILCRNVLIYFDRDLQARVLDLFSRSLVFKGYLCLGSHETVRFVRGGQEFQAVSDQHKIFRKVVRSGAPLQ
ncbi:CheR family methyltransferase [Oligoflexus tunisiensis]|uniref:CheR family methyltransferase n=1 Tax=Oligoflexus tunisiensis TaxID=708132 RepID=UPI000AB479AE|nr:protein-glutamate O-methyltransferase CheR [Oligoflexus tunisiensis]